MKKLMAGLVVLVFLGMSALSFGNGTYILIYNISASVKGADDDTGLAATIPLKGYLILNLSAPTTVVDANLILYGKDTTKAKVYVNLGYNTPTDQHFVDIRQVGDFFFLEIGEYTDAGPFYFDVFVMGKWKEKSVGPLVAGNKAVASSMKGIFVVWDGFLLGPSADQDISGTSNISLTLNASGTKWANGNNEEDEIKTPAQIVDEVIGLDGMLTDKGFQPAVLP
ncbi:MAG: hypothetical protein ABSH16_08770 [Sedimentisphaerales bacterium]